MRSKTDIYLWLIVGLLLIVTGLATSQLTKDIYWLDEELALYRAMGGANGPFALGEAMERITLGSWPPLYYVLLIISSTFLGWSEFATRSLSLFAGLLSIAMTYRFACDLFSKQVGFIAALLLATSAFYLHYFHEARGYTLYALVSVTCIWAYWRLLNQQRMPTKRQVNILALLLAAVIYTHYIAAVTCLAIGLYHLLFVPRSRRWREIFRSFIYALILFLPWVSVSFIMAVGESQLDRGMANLTALHYIFHAFSNGFMPLVLLGLAYTAFIKRNQVTFFISFWLIVAIVAALIMNIATDFLFHIRHVIVLLVPIVILLAVGFVDLIQKQRLVGISVVIVWVFLGLYNYTDDNFMSTLPAQVATLPADEFAAMRGVIDGCVEDSDLVIVHTSANDERLNERVLYYYLGETEFSYAQLGRMGDISRFDVPYHFPDDMLANIGDYETRFELLATDAPRTWLFVLGDASSVPQWETFHQQMQISYEMHLTNRHPTGLEIEVYANGSGNFCDVLSDSAVVDLIRSE